MALALLTVVLALVAGHLATRGGRRRGTPIPPLRSLPLLVASFAVQVVEPWLSGFVPYGYPLALAVSATLGVQFVLRNAAAPGVVLVGLGLVLNALVVLANGAMPVSVAAAARAGLPEYGPALAADARHDPVGPSTRLRLLADVVPAPVPGAREVVSVGDMLLAAGLGLFAFTAVTRPPRRRQPDRRSEVSDAGTADTRNGVSAVNVSSTTT